MNRIARGAARANRALGTLTYRALGLVAGLAALNTGRWAWVGVQSGAYVDALVLGGVSAACGAFAWWCFRPGKKLTDLEP